MTPGQLRAIVPLAPRCSPCGGAPVPRDKPGCVCRGPQPSPGEHPFGRVVQDSPGPVLRAFRLASVPVDAWHPSLAG